MVKKHIIRHIQDIRSISVLLLGSISGAGIAFLTQVFLARQLGPFEFGIFSAALATITLLTPLAGFGVAQYWLKVFGQEGWSAIRWLPGSFRFVSVSTLLVIILVNIWALFGPNDEATASVLLILSACVPGQLSVELVSAKLQLEERYTQLALWQLMPSFLRLLFLVLLAFAATSIFTLQMVVIGYAVVALTVFVVGSIQLIGMVQGRFALKGHISNESGNSRQASASYFCKPKELDVAFQAFPFGLAGIFYLIYFQSDVILLKYLSGPKAAGMYNVAFVIMLAIYLFPSVIYQKFMLPKLHRWANYDRSRFYQTYRVGRVIMFGLGLIAMILLWVFAPFIIPLLFGLEYQGAVKIIMLLAVCTPIRFLATSVGATLVTQDHMRRKVRYMGMTATINIILNVILIPEYSVMGAAVSTIVSDVVLLIFYLLSAKKHVFAMENVVR